MFLGFCGGQIPFLTVLRGLRSYLSSIHSVLLRGAIAARYLRRRQGDNNECLILFVLLVMTNDNITVVRKN